jgi:hypothetical protein
VSTINKAIPAFVGVSRDNVSGLDKYKCWIRYEPVWTTEQYEDKDSSLIQYWLQLESKYPNLARFAIDILTILALLCKCERMFSELSDMLEPKRQAIGPQLLVAIQMVGSWRKAGFKLPLEGDDKVTDAEIIREFNLCEWEGFAS